MTEYRKWTPEEVALLKDRATSSTVQELAQELGRPVKMVRWKLKKLGLTPVDARKFGKGVPVSVWTPDRLQYLRDNAQTTPVVDMAEHLGVSISSVRGALFEHKIPGRGYCRKSTPEEIEKRIAPLRGVVKVDPLEPRVCRRCGEVAVPHRYPHEKSVSTKLCATCRKLDMTERRYGLKEGDLQKLLESQGGGCAMCGADFKTVRMCVDHDHSCCSHGRKMCGKCVRGLLCFPCNLLEGQLGTFLARGGTLESLLAYGR